MYASYSTCWRRVSRSVPRHVLPGQEPPGARDQLGVGLVAAERRDVQGAVVGRRDEDGTAHRLVVLRLDRGGLGPDARQRLADDLGRRATDRGPERVVDRGRDAPAQHDGPEQVGGERGVDVEGFERDRHDEHLADPAHRAGEVRRCDHDHRDRHREPHGGEARRVGEVERAPDRLPERRVVGQEGESAPDDPARGTRDEEVPGQAPAPDEDRPDREEPERPDREDLVAEDDERPTVVGEVRDRVDEVAFDARRVVCVDDEPRDDNRRDDHPDDVAGPAPARTVFAPSDQEVPESGPPRARRLIRQGPYSSGSLTSSGNSSP